MFLSYKCCVGTGSSCGFSAACFVFLGGVGQARPEAFICLASVWSNMFFACFLLLTHIRVYTCVYMCVYIYIYTYIYIYIYI